MGVHPPIELEMEGGGSVLQVPKACWEWVGGWVGGWVD